MMVNTDFKPCALIPVYNHEHAIVDVVKRVLSHEIDCLLVNDGSQTSCTQTLQRLAFDYPDRIRLFSHPENLGKGAAVMTGILCAHELEYTHVLQIDADGQHDTNDIPVFLKKAETEREAVIIGYPVYDRSVPVIRLYCRYLTHIWVWINTLAFTIKDSMCGFRVYPVSPVLTLMKTHRFGQRMTFDTDILVRLYWDGVKISNLPTRVTYPADGISHFRPLRDNIQISLMHARLFFGMLIRVPRLLRLKWKRS